MNTPTASAPESAGAELPSTLPAEPKSPFIVVQQPILEGNTYYLKGQTVMLTAARAAKLGTDQVKAAPAVPTTEAAK